MSNQKTIAKTIRLHPEVIKTIEDLATKENRNFSNMVETILIKYSENYCVCKICKDTGEYLLTNPNDYGWKKCDCKTKK